MLVLFQVAVFSVGGWGTLSSDSSLYLLALLNSF